MASQGRFAARLARLPHDTLAELAASLCCTNEVNRRTADSTLALHDPTPAWAIERILTSPDLVQCIFVHVDIYDGVAAATCKAWKRGWDATDGQRRGLRPAELAEPDFELSNYAQITSLPGERLCVSDERAFHIVDTKMQTLHVHETDFDVGFVGASEDGLFVCDLEHPKLRRYRLEEDSRLTLQATYEDTRDAEERYQTFYYPTAAPDGVLFAVGVVPAEPEKEEIVAFDAATLTVSRRFAFGRGRFGKGQIYGMAAVGDELYVTDPSDHCVRVFSMSGEHLRDMRGDWWRPHRLLFVRDRLYMIECDGDSEGQARGDQESVEEWRVRQGAGKRIIVLTPEGETLQKYRHTDLRSMAVHGDKLIVRFQYSPTLVALKGL